jgi:hypothetical protein
MTEFYKSIPDGIREKLQEYSDKINPCGSIDICNGLEDMFFWAASPEGHRFWQNHFEAKTFPIWSEQQNRFINP